MRRALPREAVQVSPRQQLATVLLLDRHQRPPPACNSASAGHVHALICIAAHVCAAMHHTPEHLQPKRPAPLKPQPQPRTPTPTPAPISTPAGRPSGTAPRPWRPVCRRPRSGTTSSSRRVGGLGAGEGPRPGVCAAFLSYLPTGCWWDVWLHPAPEPTSPHRCAGRSVPSPIMDVRVTMLAMHFSPPLG